MAGTKFLFLHHEASVDNLLVLNCSTVVYVIITEHTLLHCYSFDSACQNPLLPGKGGLILLLYLDMKSVAEEGTMTGVASADLTVVGTAAGVTNQMRMTGQSLSPQVNAWNSKSWNSIDSWGRVT